MGIAEAGVDVGGQRQALVVGKFLADCMADEYLHSLRMAVPGETAAKLSRQVSDVFDECGHDAPGVLVGDLCEFNVTGVTPDQRRDAAVFEQAIGFHAKVD